MSEQARRIARQIWEPICAAGMGPVTTSYDEGAIDIIALVLDTVLPKTRKRATGFRGGVEAMRKRVEAILEDLQEQGRIDYPSEVFERIEKAAKELAEKGHE